MSDATEIRRKRILFRAHYRGMRETDRLVGGFADAAVGAMSDAQLGRFESLLDQSDVDLLAWIMGIRPPPPAFDDDVMTMMIEFKNKM